MEAPRFAQGWKVAAPRAAAALGGSCGCFAGAALLPATVRQREGTPGVYSVLFWTGNAPGTYWLNVVLMFDQCRATAACKVERRWAQLELVGPRAAETDLGAGADALTRETLAELQNSSSLPRNGSMNPELAGRARQLGFLPKMTVHSAPLPAHEVRIVPARTAECRARDGRVDWPPHLLRSGIWRRNTTHTARPMRDATQRREKYMHMLNFDDRSKSKVDPIHSAVVGKRCWNFDRRPMNAYPLTRAPQDIRAAYLWDGKGGTQGITAPRDRWIHFVGKSITLLAYGTLRGLLLEGLPAEEQPHVHYAHTVHRDRITYFPSLNLLLTMGPHENEGASPTEVVELPLSTFGRLERFVAKLKSGPKGTFHAQAIRRLFEAHGPSALIYNRCLHSAETLNNMSAVADFADNQRIVMKGFSDLLWRPNRTALVWPNCAPLQLYSRQLSTMWKCRTEARLECLAETAHAASVEAGGWHVLDVHSMTAMRADAFYDNR